MAVSRMLSGESFIEVDRTQNVLFYKVYDCLSPER